MDRRDLMAQSFDTETAFVDGIKAMLAGFELKHAQKPRRSEGLSPWLSMTKH
jgi:hypothetical protein